MVTTPTTGGLAARSRNQSLLGTRVRSNCEGFSQPTASAECERSGKSRLARSIAMQFASRLAKRSRKSSSRKLLPLANYGVSGCRNASECYHLVADFHAPVARSVAASKDRWFDEENARATQLRAEHPTEGDGQAGELFVALPIEIQRRIVGNQVLGIAQFGHLIKIEGGEVDILAIVVAPQAVALDDGRRRDAAAFQELRVDQGAL